MNMLGIGTPADMKAAADRLEGKLDRIIQLLETLLAAQLHDQGMTSKEIADLILRKK